MCCQITPAMGIDPMKPMTTIRLRLIATINASRTTRSTPEFRRDGSASPKTMLKFPR